MKSYPFATLFRANKDENMLSKKFSQPVGQYISRSSGNNLLSETIISKTETAFIWSNSPIIIVEQRAKYVHS